MIGYLHSLVPGGVLIFLPVDHRDIDRKEVATVEVMLQDGRTISPEQRRKAYAIMRDIAEYTGYTPEEVKDLMKWSVESEDGRTFSLANCDVTTANRFLEHIIDFCLRWDIPTRDSLSDAAPEIGRYLYACLANKKCAICGAPAQLHHVDRVGMGSNRRILRHVGLRAMALCPEHHRACHSMPQKEFDDGYHIYGIVLDRTLCQIWGLFE